jgi:hypothetical protein
MNEAIFAVIETAKKDAAEYARNYQCQPEYKAAIEVQHFCYLINDAIHDIKTLAAEHLTELRRSPN